ncbi:ATP synthase F0 sector subunit b [hydrothermal vent metagenome]|uniref:ATP synthase F0 sector subunit b n=1 Tax=hydrothermal vent metagenome TaxID=652676 RepID=A0A1W1C6Z4_9ZZZZ
MKMKQLLLAVVVLVPAILFANEGAGHYEALTGRSTDFIPRIFNFLVFAGIAYYLLANPIKSFFVGRQKSISDQLKEIEEKLQASKDEKKNAEANLEESKAKAEEIIKTADKEAKILSDKIAENSENELKAIEKQYQEKSNLEERRAIRAAINEVLSSNITTDDIPLDEKRVIDLIDKKVA